jgi:hypothetical protein
MTAGVDRISIQQPPGVHPPPHPLAAAGAGRGADILVLQDLWRHRWLSTPGVRFLGTDGWAGGVARFDSFVNALLDPCDQLSDN